MKKIVSSNCDLSWLVLGTDEIVGVNKKKRPQIINETSSSIVDQCLFRTNFSPGMKRQVIIIDPGDGFVRPGLKNGGLMCRVWSRADLSRNFEIIFHAYLICLLNA